MRIHFAATTALILALPLNAFAQVEPPPPTGLVEHEAATSGSTNVAVEGFQQAVAPEPSAERITELSASAGGNFTTGNAQNLNATAGVNYLVRRRRSQLTAAAAVNYGETTNDVEGADGSTSEVTQTTVENYQARAKYDYFALDHASLFLAASARRDRFQGLLWRLNFDPGLAYYFLDEEKHRFWGELGYDLQHDVRRNGALNFTNDDGSTLVLDKAATRHYARLFGGYTNRINAAVTFNTGLEYLQGLAPFRDEQLDNINMRLNWDAALTSALSESFSVAASVGVKFDNNPLPGVTSTDTVTAIQLVYNML